MSKLKTATIPDHHKVQAKIILDEAIDATVPDRLMLIGALEEAKGKIITDGYA